MAARLLRGVALAGAAAALVVSAAFVRDMLRAYERVRGRSTVIESPYGAIEYKAAGSGPAVLVIHGSGGGYDQGELIAEAALDDQFRRITPSRLGYLRSALPEGATFDDQAHAYAHLLDVLGAETVAVVAMSHGGPSALLFAVLYPDRVSSLTLISAGVAASPVQEQRAADRRGDLLITIFRYDPLYWTISRLFRKQLMRLMGAGDAVIAGLTPAQRRLVDRVIDYMNPVSPRSAGATFDNRAALPNERVAAIRAPTLILHATDDALQLFHNADFAAEHIPGARLVRFDHGGHLLIAVEQEAIRAATRRHILDHIDETVQWRQ
jgi:2-hydroxy-6-oxonona-2,4-dienedioate hydrolase